MTILAIIIAVVLAFLVFRFVAGMSSSDCSR